MTFDGIGEISDRSSSNSNRPNEPACKRETSFKLGATSKSVRGQRIGDLIDSAFFNKLKDDNRSVFSGISIDDLLNLQTKPSIVNFGKRERNRDQMTAGTIDIVWLFERYRLSCKPIDFTNCR